MRLDTTLILAGMNPVAEAGFPDVICPVIFLTGCNLRCPYCLNSSLVNSDLKQSKISLREVASYLLDNGETNILISGGEPCINGDCLVDLAKLFCDLGIKVRLSTNGTYPTVLEMLLKADLLSFVAVDIKTNVFGDSLKMALLAGHKSVEIAKCLALNINQSLCDISSYAKNHKVFSYEVRTTLYPPTVDEDDIVAIAKHIPSDAVWVLQQFRAKKGLLGGDDVASVVPYGNDVLDKMLNEAKRYVKNVSVRYP